MKQVLARIAHRILRALGLSAVRTAQTYDANRARVFQAAEIDLLIDVGANQGQYASAVRKAGFDGWICSFEPLPEAFQRLARARRKDSRWQGRNVALGAEPGTSSFHVSADSVCSSIRPPSADLLAAIPAAATVREITVPIVRLDEESLPDFSRAALKLDVQGYEKDVLKGASGLIARVQLLEIELAVTPTYDCAYGLSEAIRDLGALGFEAVSLGRGASDSHTGRLLDVDVLFRRRS